MKKVQKIISRHFPVQNSPNPRSDKTTTCVKTKRASIGTPEMLQAAANSDQTLKISMDGKVPKVVFRQPGRIPKNTDEKAFRKERMAQN